MKNNVLLVVMIVSYCHSVLPMKKDKDRPSMVTAVRRFSEKQRYHRSLSLQKMFANKFTIEEIKATFADDLRQFADEFELPGLTLDYLLATKNSHNLTEEEVEKKKKQKNDLEILVSFCSRRRTKVKESNLEGCCELLFSLAASMSAYKNVFIVLHEEELINEEGCSRGLTIANRIVDFSSKIEVENPKIARKIKEKHSSLKAS